MQAPGRNRGFRIQVGDLDDTVECNPQNEDYTHYTFHFEATSPITTLTLQGIGEGAFGPMIDDVGLRGL